MTTFCNLLTLAVLGFFLGVSCGNDSLTGPGGSGGGGGSATSGSGVGGTGTGGAGGGGGGIGGTGCQRMEYRHPGCGGNAVAVCTDGWGGSCAGPPACGCDGRVLGGCYIFSEPFAYMFTRNFSLDGGNTCDPAADGGQ